MNIMLCVSVVMLMEINYVTMDESNSEDEGQKGILPAKETEAKLSTSTTIAEFARTETESSKPTISSSMPTPVTVPLHVITIQESVISTLSPTEKTTTTAAEADASTAANSISMPTYGVYLIGTTMLIMFLAIIFLTIKLFMLQNRERSYSRPDTPVSISFDKGAYRTEKSSEMCQAKSINSINTTYTQGFEPRVIITNPSKIIGATEGSSISADCLSINPGNLTSKQKYVPSNIILREQMAQICKDVLSKRKMTSSTSSKNLNELLNEVKSYEQEPKNVVVQNDKQKSTSNPELDLYDHVPLPKLAIEKFPVINSDEKIIDTDDDTYDSPPVRPNYDVPLHVDTKNTTQLNIIVDNESEYLLPLAGPNKEPSYINANRNSYLL